MVSGNDVSMDGTTPNHCYWLYYSGPPEDPLGGSINPANLFFVERFSSLGSLNCIVGIILGL